MPAKKTKEIVVVSGPMALAYIETFAKDSLTLLQTVGANYSPKVREVVLATYLQALVRYAVIDVLTSVPETILTEEEAFQDASKKFRIIKGQVQEAVALAFGRALSDFSGRNAEYYCQITPVPPVANKENH